MTVCLVLIGGDDVLTALLFYKVLLIIHFPEGFIILIVFSAAPPPCILSEFLWIHALLLAKQDDHSSVKCESGFRVP